MRLQLHTGAFRPGEIGDQLITTEFWNTTTRGFAPVGEPKVAVCLLPGTEVAFESEVQRVVTGFQLRFFKREPEHIRHTVARFRQVNVENPHAHHDAIEFPDGLVVLLTHLRIGQRASVLQLPAQAKPAADLGDVKTEARVATSADAEIIGAGV